MSHAHAVGAALTLLSMLVVAHPKPAEASEPPPDEDSLFGGGEEGDEDPPIKPPAITDQRLLEFDDRLQIGGQLYLRSFVSFTDGDEVEDHRISMPNIVELYLDGRPSDRIRGFVRGRLTWDPTITDDEDASPLSAFAGQQTDQVSVVLDQLWLKFDVARSLYVTVGQQAVRWGASRIWNPVDVINSTRRVPLAFFDSRTGVPMIKVHVPIESLGWNFYAIGMMDGVTTFDKAGGAARAELVFETVELGLLGAYRDALDTRVGLDLSAGVWDFDITAELGLTFDTSDEDPTNSRDSAEPTIQVSGGIEYAVKYSDSDLLYVGIEYFFNQTGASSAQERAEAALSGTAQPFYIGKHYGAFFMSFPAPGSWDDLSVTFSTLASFSDLSFMSRLDVTVDVLTFMQVQMFVAGHYGEQGELRLGPDMFGDTVELNGVAIPVAPLLEQFGLTNIQLLELGINLRIHI